MTDGEPTAAETTSLSAKAARFRSLHAEGIFVMPCAWDAGSARLFEAAGFEAIGTTSGGVNWSAGRPDYVYAVERDDMLASYGEIARAVELPVSGDLENGYGRTPEEVGETVRLAIHHGMAGGSIEDQTSEPTPGLIPLGLAADRIAAARAAADATGVDFTITARAESFFGGLDDPLPDAVERANRYAAAGADCIFIPGTTTLDQIQAVVDAVDAPISVGVGSGGDELTLDALREIGVRRVSTGGLLPRALAAMVMDASQEILQAGTFSFGAGAMREMAINALHTR